MLGWVRPKGDFPSESKSLARRDNGHLASQGNLVFWKHGGEEISGLGYTVTRIQKLQLRQLPETWT